MKIDKDKLKEALTIVKPGLANKEIIEQTTSFAFIGGFVTTYNDEICISHPISDDLEIEGAIRAEELYKFLSKVKAKEITIEEEDDQIIMKAGRSQVGFALKKEIKLPLEEELSDEGEWEDLPANFLRAVAFAAETCSTDMSDPKITCVHITKKGIIEATDNYRMVVWDLESEIPLQDVLIPANSIREMVKIQPSEVSQTEDWVHFRNEEGTVIHCRVFMETFPNSSDITNTKEFGITVKFPDKIKEVIEKAEIITKQQKKEVNTESLKIQFTKNKIIVESESESSWFKEPIPYKDGKTGFAFSITPYLLKDILSETSECQVYEHMLRFVGDGWVYVSTLQTYEK